MKKKYEEQFLINQILNDEIKMIKKSTYFNLLNW
jgi:hypothetical protein